MMGSSSFRNHEKLGYLGIAEALIEQVDDLEFAGGQPLGMDRCNRAWSARNGYPSPLPFPGDRLQGRGGAERRKDQMGGPGVIGIVGLREGERTPERVAQARPGGGGGPPLAGQHQLVWRRCRRKFSKPIAGE